MTADALFKEGRRLYDLHRFAEACPKFAESYRVDPATGSLLALASCHEAEGKLATAWSEYGEVVSRARRDGRQDRADAAQARVSALEPKLGRLTITVTPGAAALPGIAVRRDGPTNQVTLSGLPKKIGGGQVLFEYTQDPLPVPHHIDRTR